jgi:16S rRNA (guanine966-N2)-methyltransferase
LRIISGFAKGLSLVTPPLGEQSIRPTSDRGREALFSILWDKVQNACVLDLFAGTGALGLEAFSRGASFVVLVDKSPLALKIIKQNVLKCFNKYDGDAEIRVLQKNLREGYWTDNRQNNVPKKFDLIFADPPYGKNFSNSVLISLDREKVLTKEGLLVIEEHVDIELPKDLKSLKLKERRVYGDTAFFIYCCCD